MENNKITKGTNVSFRPQDLIEARYKLNAKENDILDIVMSKLNNDGNLRYNIEISDYKNYYLESDNIYKEFKRTCENISKEGLGIRDIVNKEYIYYPWFSRIKYVDREGRIEVDFHPEMKEILLKCVENKKLKKIFYNLKYSIKLTSEYAKRYYYYCKSFEDTNWRKDLITTLIEKMECPKSYSDFALFNINVLQIAKEQINKYTDLFIEIIPEKTGRKYTHILTNIRIKTSEELEAIEELINNKKKQVIVTDITNDTPLRIRIQQMLQEYKEIDKDVKEEVSSKLNLSTKSLTRYISINQNLIDELKNFFDIDFLGVLDCYNISKKNKKDVTKEDNIKRQKEQYNKIIKNCNKFRKTLCLQLGDLLMEYKITYRQAEKYSNLSFDEQMKFYKRKFKKDIELESSENLRKKNENEIAIDVDYLEVPKKNKEDEDLEEIIKILKEFNINQGQAKTIYINSNKNIKYISYIYNELKLQNKTIPNAVGWIMQMVKPNIYIKPLKQEAIKTSSFNNFEGRDYDHDSIEKKLLGWDKDENKDEPQIESLNNENKKIENINNEIDINEIKEILIIKLPLVVTEIAYNTWLKYGINNINVKNNEVIIPCSDKLTKVIIEKRYLETLTEVIKALNENIEKIILELI